MIIHGFILSRIEASSKPGVTHALTRAGLQELVLKLWRELGLTIVFVTHDTEEAIYLSTRVVALSRPPSVVAIDIPIDLPHPRDQIATRELPLYLDYRHQVLAQLFRAEGLSSASPLQQEVQP